MKAVKRMMAATGMLMFLLAPVVKAQKIDEARMERDIEVAENILNTLIKQQFERRYFFPVEVEGRYMPGYGVTFRIPGEMVGVWGSLAPLAPLNHEAPVVYYNNSAPGSYSYSYSYSDEGDEDAEEDIDNENRLRELEEENREIEEDIRKAEREAKRGMESARRELETRQRELESEMRELRSRARADVKGSALLGTTFPRVATLRSKTNRDSLSQAMNKKLIEVAKEFLADYGDLIGQLTPDERIVITNRGDGDNVWYGFEQSNRSYLSAEATRGDISQYKQGKITRDQMMSKIRVVNTQSSDKREPDLELLSSILERLYREDLSKTYFTSGDIFFERLNDYGVVYYMTVYSARDGGARRFDMPTLNLENVTQEERDQKVKELYPAFERSIKEDLLEYGRTVKSLKDEEVLNLNIKMTKCRACGIPATLELSVKGGVLKEYSSGKLAKDVALSRIVTKKGANQ